MIYPILFPPPTRFCPNLTHPTPVPSYNISLSLFHQAKTLSVEFKALTETERNRWVGLAVNDKTRYLAEMESYTPPSDLDDDDSEDDEDEDDDGNPRRKKKKSKNSTTSKKRRAKDPNAPKRNQSSFFLYSNATRNDVRTAHPTAKFGEIAQIISRHFRGLPEDERAYWDEAARQDKIRYQAALESYKKSNA